VNFRNQAATFLANYRNNEASALAGLAVQEKTNETQRRGLATSEFESGNALSRARTTAEQTITAARTARESAQIAYNNALKNRGLTLSKLALSESDAGLSLSQAREEFDKLVIRAPIDGSITRVLASVGQDVNAGSLMIEMANKSPEMQIDVEVSIVPLLTVGSEQSILYDGVRMIGTVVGVSQIANESLLYSVRIALKDTPKLLGQVATVELVIASEHSVLGTDLVRVISDRKGELSTLSGGVIVPVEVDLGRIAGARVEITTKLDDKTPIIVNNVSNFDPKRSEIVVKQ
jgi:multidrug efflux pump subunit AcrA (membrane-fusion protein)